MAVIQSIPDDEIAAELAAALPEDEWARVPSLRAVTAGSAGSAGAGAAERGPLSRRRANDPRDLREAHERIRPTALAREQTLALDPALAAALPDGLVRGTTVSLSDDGQALGVTSLALLLGAGASRAGSWIAVVGLPSLGLAAADELGVDLGRLAVIDMPPADSWAAVVGALIGGFDLVLFGAPPSLRMADMRRLSARARERGSVLVHVDTGAASARGIAGAAGGSGRGDERDAAGRAGSVAARSRRRVLDADLRVRVVDARWTGIGAGHGHVQGREVVIEVAGRRSGAPARHGLSLPAPSGVAAICTIPVPVEVTAPPGPPVRSPVGQGDAAASYAGSDVERLVDGLLAARRTRAARAGAEPLAPDPRPAPAALGLVPRATAEMWSDAG